MSDVDPEDSGVTMVWDEGLGKEVPRATIHRERRIPDSIQRTPAAEPTVSGEEHVRAWLSQLGFSDLAIDGILLNRERVEYVFGQTADIAKVVPPATPVVEVPLTNLSPEMAYFELFSDQEGDPFKISIRLSVSEWKRYGRPTTLFIPLATERIR